MRHALSRNRWREAEDRSGWGHDCCSLPQVPGETPGTTRGTRVLPEAEARHGSSGLLRLR